MAVFRGVNVVTIAVPDLQRAKTFYKDTLEFGEPIYDLPDSGWIKFNAGAAEGNLYHHGRL